MGTTRQLAMAARLDRPLPELPPLPEGVCVHTPDAGAHEAWNWIIRASFEDEKLDYSMIEDDPVCAPERVFFLRCEMGDVATATGCLLADGTGRIHMVGAHPSASGRGYGIYVVLEAMRALQALGVTRCTLATDDFRLPAIRIYERLGFEPDYAPDDAEMAQRWAAIAEKLAQRP